MQLARRLLLMSAALAGLTAAAGAAPPNDPTDVYARTVNTSSVRIIWQNAGDPDGDAVEFRVEEVGNASNNSGWLAPGTTSWEATGLAAGWTGRWQVQARDTGGATSSAVQSDDAHTYPRPLEGFGLGEPGGPVNVGGLDGETYVVTNLDDSGPGSFRDAVTGSNRYITFAVGGTINLQSQIRLGSTHHITVDATTAPPPGITLDYGGGNILLLDETDPDVTHDVIFRNLRFINDQVNGGDCFAIGGEEGNPNRGTYNIIVDHCSFRHAFDGNLDIADYAHNVTVQWCILAENTKNQIIREGAYDISVHHNLYFDYHERGPAVKQQRGAGVVDVVNNVNYAWNNEGQEWVGMDQDPGEGNTVKCVFVPDGGSDVTRSINFQSGNEGYSTGHLFFGGSRTSGTPGQNSRYAAPPISTETSADQALVAVLAEAGAQPRDAADAGYVAVVNAATGGTSPDNEAPNDPSGVSAATLGSSAIRIQWSDNGDPDGDAVQFYVREVSNSSINSGWLAAGTTTWDATGLTADTSYRFEVQARDNAVPQGFSNWVGSNAATTDPETGGGNSPPNAPTIVTSTVLGATTIRVSWANNGDPDGDAVEFYVRDANDSSRNSGWLGGGTVTWDATGLTPITTYTFEVQARDDANPPATTGWVAASPVTTSAPSGDVTAPAEASDFEILDVGQDFVLLSWTATGDDGTVGVAARYDLRRSTSPIDIGNFLDATPIAGVPSPLPAGETELVNVGRLVPSTLYYFGLVIEDEAGNRSTLSNVLSIETLEGDPAPVPPPPAPETSWSAGTIVLSWEPSASPVVAGYHVYRRDADSAPGSEARLTSFPEPDLNYIDNGVEAGSAYYYRISAVDDGGNESPRGPESYAIANAVPLVPVIERVYPNPIRSQAVFRFGVPDMNGNGSAVRVTIDLFDVSGKRVGRVLDDTFQPGTQEVTWRPGDSAARFAPGMYLSVLKAGNASTQGRIVLAPSSTE